VQGESKQDFMVRRVAEIVDERRGVKRKRSGVPQPTPHEAAQLEFDAINIASAGGGRGARSRHMGQDARLACFAGSLKAAKKASLE
jgi:hypothetical protein